MAGVFAIGGLAIAQIPAAQNANVTLVLAATDGADSASFSVSVAAAPFTPVGESGGKGFDPSPERRELLRWGLGRRRRHEDEREATEDIRWELEKAIDPKDKPDGMDSRVWALLQSARNPDQVQYDALVKQIEQEDEDDIESILALLP